MSTARGSTAGAVISGKLYALGGGDTAGHLISSVEVYDPLNNFWTADTSLTASRASIGMGVINNIGYAVGGSDAVNALSVVEAFVPSGPWTTLGPISPPREGP